MFHPRKLVLTFVTLVLLAFAAPIVEADTITLVVPGTSDPWLAGMPARHRLSWSSNEGS